MLKSVTKPDDRVFAFIYMKYEQHKYCSFLNYLLAIYLRMLGKLPAGVSLYNAWKLITIFPCPISFVSKCMLNISSTLLSWQNKIILYVLWSKSDEKLEKVLMFEDFMRLFFSHKIVIKCTMSYNYEMHKRWINNTTVFVNKASADINWFCLKLGEERANLRAFRTFVLFVLV